uniref:Myelin protein P0 C-terminal domain-containing protein n=1 Tax=Anolis carolinensis TaxID=28377 RepID=A0A803TIH0_ANOCA
MNFPGFPKPGTSLSPPPVLYAMLDHSRLTKSAGEKKSKGGLCDLRKDRK